MPNDNKLIWVLQSRKFWSAAIGLIAILYMSLVNGAELDPDTVVTAIMGIVGAYMGATALEDGLTNHNATTTTLTTPSENVTVSTSDDAATVLNSAFTGRKP